MHSMTAPVLASELATILSWVGFPKQILADQETTLWGKWCNNSDKPLRTSVTHPQTNGLGEWFNGTTKHMLHKFALTTPRQCPRWLPLLLFAVGSTSGPFENLYGRQLRGVLDFLWEKWAQLEEKQKEPTQCTKDLEEAHNSRGNSLTNRSRGGHLPPGKRPCSCCQLLKVNSKRNGRDPLR